MYTSLGQVYLLGAGPGNKIYLSLQARDIISQAEVLITDALVDEDVLSLAPADCLKLEVGKRGGQPSTPQQKINQLLVYYCQQGKRVVRLKSGNPLIFGRSNEEIEALVAANCDFRVIPGMSSALAAPALANIPLTDKVLSQCFVVLTGHQPDALNWQAIALIDTIVILMGTLTLPSIIDFLLRNGRSPQTPIAIIKNAGHYNQNIWQGTLTNIVEKTQNLQLSPAVIVIGEVVKLRKKMSNLPLENQTILVTRAADQSSQFTELLTAKGAKVVEMPALEITEPSSWKLFDQAIAKISEFNWLILTSANGIEYFFKRIQQLGKDTRILGNLQIAVVGKKTAATLTKYHLKPDFIPPDFVADSLIEHFPENLDNQKILFPRVESGGRDVLIKELTQQGAQITEVAAYQSGCPEKIDPKILAALQKKEINIITFASSKTVRNFVTLLKSAGENNLTQLLKNVKIASIGPQTSHTCQELLGRYDLEAQEYTLEGLTKALISVDN
jgi:uroporphyrinogen III methyltransferase/synthase